MKRDKTADDFYDNADRWRDELRALRQTLLTTGLDETVKWGMPVYVSGGKNIVGVGAFKNHFGLWFFQGALLADDAQHLINAQPGQTKAMRQWRMTTAKEIKPAQIKRYVKEAVLVAASGAAITPARPRPAPAPPPELARALQADKQAQTAFKALTASQRREYCEHIADAKMPATKQRRIEKVLPMIMRGAGLHDKYRR